MAAEGQGERLRAEIEELYRASLTIRPTVSEADANPRCIAYLQVPSGVHWVEGHGHTELEALTALRDRLRESSDG